MRLRPALHVLLAALALAGCEDDRPHAVATRVPGGDARAGHAIVQAYGCAACHTIPGIRGPRGRVGPSLDRFAERLFIAGHVPNRPELLTRWLLDPPAIQPGTAMPNLGLTQAQAEHVAAFLYSLD